MSSPSGYAARKGFGKLRVRKRRRDSRERIVKQKTGQARDKVDYKQRAAAPISKRFTVRDKADYKQRPTVTSKRLTILGGTYGSPHSRGHLKYKPPERHIIKDLKCLLSSAKEQNSKENYRNIGTKSHFHSKYSTDSSPDVDDPRTPEEASQSYQTLGNLADYEKKGDYIQNKTKLQYDFSPPSSPRKAKPLKSQINKHPYNLSHRGETREEFTDTSEEDFGVKHLTGQRQIQNDTSREYVNVDNNYKRTIAPVASEVVLQNEKDLTFATHEAKRPSLSVYFDFCLGITDALDLEKKKRFPNISYRADVDKALEALYNKRYRGKQNGDKDYDTHMVNETGIQTRGICSLESEKENDEPHVRMSHATHLDHTHYPVRGSSEGRICGGFGTASKYVEVSCNPNVNSGESKSYTKRRIDDWVADCKLALQRPSDFDVPTASMQEKECISQQKHDTVLYKEKALQTESEDTRDKLKINTNAKHNAKSQSIPAQTLMEKCHPQNIFEQNVTQTMHSSNTSRNIRYLERTLGPGRTGSKTHPLQTQQEHLADTCYSGFTAHSNSVDSPIFNEWKAVSNSPKLIRKHTRLQPSDERSIFLKLGNVNPPNDFFNPCESEEDNDLPYRKQQQVRPMGRKETVPYGNRDEDSDMDVLEMADIWGFSRNNSKVNNNPFEVCGVDSGAGCDFQNTLDGIKESTPRFKLYPRKMI